VSAETVPRPLPAAEREPWPRFLRIMAWIGLNSFGGPIAQLGVMHREFVERHAWLTDAQFVHLLNFANVIPGPEALELCIHAGYLRRGVWGGVVAGMLFIWPGFVSLTLLGWIYVEYGHWTWIEATLDGIRPVALALVAAAAIRISRKALQGSGAILIAGLAFVASFVLDVPFIAILLGAGVLGRVLGPRHDRAPSSRPVHGRLFVLLVVGVIAVGLIRHRETSESSQTFTHRPSSSERVFPQSSGKRMLDIAWVNTKAALLTFGGAYTVFPFLREQCVEKHRWLSDGQMMDAVALGETTPGPLISVGVFTAYLAGGFWGSVVGCFFLFLPSFVFVLGLGRHIDRIENLPHATHVLWGFSAGTLGLILALAATLVPPSIRDVFSAGLAALAFLAAWRFNVNLIAVIAGGAALGVLRAMFWG
jgi:chromate transporter